MWRYKGKEKKKKTWLIASKVWIESFNLQTKRTCYACINHPYKKIEQHN